MKNFCAQLSAHSSNVFLQFNDAIVHLFSPAAPALHAALVKACSIEALLIGARRVPPRPRGLGSEAPPRKTSLLAESGHREPYN